MPTATPVIVSAKRTPIGRFMGGLSRVPATELGALAIKAVLADAPALKEKVDEVIMGVVLQAGLGQNPARQAGLKAGLSNSLNAFTVNKVCGSSLKAAMLAAQAIKAGDGDSFIVGGMENMSLAPHLTYVRAGIKFGDAQLIDHMRADGLHCPFCDWGMGSAAEWIAKEYNISRAEQDRFAVQSHQRAAAAQAKGWYGSAIVPVSAADAKQKQDITADEGVRADTTLESVGKLKPAFDKAGTVTAANSSQISDGAAALAIASESRAQAMGLRPLARIVSYHTHGVDPKELFIAPVEAIRGCVSKAGLGVEDVDLFEINEAFAAQMLADLKSLEISEDRVNVCGGGVAIGHPIGASGARVLVTLVHQLKRLNLKRGVASLCLGGGNAVAMLIERV
ncbi:MAG: thiolase family protein [Phycisphaerales bacterium]|nr:thiolase family protein [Phycisphaerales bacterium]